MQYRNQIPATLLNENANLDNFVSVLDGIEAYKTEVVEKAVRFSKAPLLTDLNWLRKKAEDLGWPTIPADFKKDQLDAMILSAENVMALKGSKMGLKLFIWVLTFGDITIDDSNFYPQGEYIIPSDEFYGYVSHFETLEDYNLYLFSDFSDFGTQALIIDVATKYHYMASLKEYILANIRSFISFTPEDFVPTITFTPGTYVTYSEPYQYFVIP